MVESRRASGLCRKGTGMGQPCLIAGYSQVSCLVMQELELIRREGHEHITRTCPRHESFPLDSVSLHWPIEDQTLVQELARTNHTQTPVGEEQEYWVLHFEKADSRAATFLTQRSTYLRLAGQGAVWVDTSWALLVCLGKQLWTLTEARLKVAEDFLISRRDGLSVFWKAATKIWVQF